MCFPFYVLPFHPSAASWCLLFAKCPNQSRLETAKPQSKNKNTKRQHAAGQASISRTSLSANLLHSCTFILIFLSRSPQQNNRILSNISEFLLNCTRMDAYMLALPRKIHEKTRKEPITGTMVHTQKNTKFRPPPPHFYFLSAARMRSAWARISGSISLPSSRCFLNNTSNLENCLRARSISSLV